MLLELIQLFFGYLFLNTGLEKLLHPGHAAAAVDGLLPNLHSLAKPFGRLLIVIELGMN